MQPTVYTYLDAEAPKLENTMGSLSTILKACLVTGYGSKQSVNWSILLEERKTDKSTFVFRSNSEFSVRNCYLFEEYTNYLDVQAYAQYDPKNKDNELLINPGKWMKGQKGTGEYKWVVVANDLFVHVFINAEKDNGVSFWQCFGDVVNLAEDQNEYAIISGFNSTSYSSSNCAHKYFLTNTIEQILLPNHTYTTDFQNYGYGGRADYIKNGVDVFMQAIGSINSNPKIAIPGLIMAARCTATSSEMINIIKGDGFTYQNDLLGFWQSWMGDVWIHTDDWSVVR